MITFERNDRVKLVEHCPGGELEIGDTGTIVAAWIKQLIAIRWDKDGMVRRVHRKRLEKAE